MSTCGIGRWRERKGGQFASRTHLTTQRRAMLAPVQKWRKEWTTSTTAPSSSVKVLRWVKVEATDDEAEEEAMAAALDRAGGRDTAQLAGLSGVTDTDTPPAGSMTPSRDVGTPGGLVSKPRTPHPLVFSQSIDSPRAAPPEEDQSMSVDTERDDIDEPIRAASKLREVINTDEAVAVAALENLPAGEDE